MKAARALLTGSRLLLLAFCLLTSGYCLLCYVPFTYTQFVEPRLVGWLSFFADAHAWLFLILVGLLAGSFEGVFARGPGPKARAPRALLVALALAGVGLVVHPVLPRLTSDAAALGWAIAALLPAAAVGIVDLVVCARGVAWGEADRADDLRLFAVAVGSALLTALLNFALVPASLAGAGLAGRALVLGATMLAHLTAFLGLYLVLLLLRGIAGLAARPARNELVSGALLAACVVSATIARFVLPALSIRHTPGYAYAAGIGLAVAVACAGLAVRLAPVAGEGRVASGFSLLVAPLGPPSRSLVARAASLCAIVGAAYVLVSATAVMDWNHLLRRLGSMLLWPFVFAWMDALLPRRGVSRRALPAAILACVACVGLFRIGEPAAALLTRYAAYDGSYAALRAVLARRSEPAQDAPDFFDFLVKHTNISRAIKIAPVEVSLAPTIAPSTLRPPNIFMIVIDSLRQDYLGPYNSKVSFTPQIDAFARDAVVFGNAFTRYGATGLSEPSIWVGGMIVHQQYPAPFQPMNSLEKLLHAEDYRSIVSMDSILRVLLEPSPALADLDAGVSNMSYTLCRSLDVLREKLDAGAAREKPLFVYTQPQDVHVSVITRESASVPPGESYPGFYAPYASRIRGLDACFGAFLSDLKARGLYDESLIVLTSDHGDSLGEGGRWGHAYTLFPEIVRIPLLMKIPKSMQASFHADPEEVAFTTDVTPTIYELLGHSPTLREGDFGRPLFRRNGTAPRAHEGGWLLASSYGPVYGLLGHDAQSLYIVDAINYEDWYFDLASDPTGERNLVNEAIRRESRTAIRRGIETVHEFYRTGDLN